MSDYDRGLAVRREVLGDSVMICVVQTALFRL